MADPNYYYSDIDDVREKLMDEASETDIADAVMIRAALHVYNVLNAKLGKIYSVPFPLFETGNTPGIIVEISDTLTACWSYTHTRGLSTRSRGPTADECKRAMDLIDTLASGAAVIEGYASTALPSSNTDGEHRVFDKVSIYEMGQDPDQAERLSDERD